SGTTAYTAAWVMLNETSELMIQMSKLSIEEFLMFHHDFGVGFQQKGSLRINTTDYSKYEWERAKLLGNLGISYEVLNVDEIKAVAPILNVEDIGIGILCRGDGVVDAQALLQTYVKQAQVLGAQKEEGVRVTNISVRNARVVGVETTHGFVSTPIVINAAGI